MVRTQDYHPGKKYKKHWHQRRLTDVQINNIDRRLNEIDITSQYFDDFEQLIKFVRTPNIKFFKFTNSYDFAFRYGFNHSLLPEKYVYIHAGAREGANILRDKGYLSFNPDDCRIAHKDFPPALRQLSAYHLEDFLCVMKKQLLDLPQAQNQKQ